VRVLSDSERRRKPPFAILLFGFGIAVIIAAVLLPSNTRARAQARVSKARADIASITWALKTYYVEYGACPFPEQSREERDNAAVMAVLMGKSEAQNPRRIVFLEADSQRVRDGTYIDPWGHSYHIMVDANYDERVAIGGATLKTPVAVWSDGPNRMNEFGGGDDVRSWE